MIKGVIALLLIFLLMGLGMVGIIEATNIATYGSLYSLFEAFDYVDLRNNNSMGMSELSKLTYLLGSAAHSQDYSDSFDCVYMSMECERFLEENGYDARIMLSYHEGNGHAWVLVTTKSGWIPIETTTNPLVCMGTLVSSANEDYYQGFMVESASEVEHLIQK